MTAYRPFLLALCCGAALLCAESQAGEVVDRLVRPRLQSLGIIIPSSANPFFSRLARGAMDRGLESNPSLRVTTIDTGYSPAAEVEALKRMSLARVQLVLLASACNMGCSRRVDAMRRIGAVVVAVDVKAEGVDATVESDNPGAGFKVCTWLAERIRGQGNFVILNGPQVSSVIERVEGCRKALQRYPGIHLLADAGNGLGSPWGGNMLMREHLQRYPKIDALFAINDRQALGAEAAMQKAGRGRVVIGSVDGAPEVRLAMSRPGLIQVSAVQDPREIGRRGAEIGIAVQQGSYVGPAHLLLPIRLLLRPPAGAASGP